MGVIMKSRIFNLYLFIFLLLASFNTAAANERAYNMILTEKTFSYKTHCYVLLGLDKNGTWNLLGGMRESIDKNNGITAARELYEESGTLIDKRGDVAYWSSLPFYEWGKHKVFIHDPKNLNINVSKLTEAAKRALADKNLPYSYREITRYQLIKLIDLVDLADAQSIKGQSGFYNHSQESNAMKIDGWLLYTLKYADKAALRPYMY